MNRDQFKCQANNRLGALPQQILSLSAALRTSNTQLNDLKRVNTSLRHVLKLRGDVEGNDNRFDLVDNATNGSERKPVKDSKLDHVLEQQLQDRVLALEERLIAVNNDNILLTSNQTNINKENYRLKTELEKELELRSRLESENKDLKDRLRELEKSLQEEVTANINRTKDLDHLRTQWRESVTERRRLMTDLNNIRGSIRVFCRVRPHVHSSKAINSELTNSVDIEDDAIILNTSSCNDIKDEASLHVKPLNRYQFETVFDPRSKNKDLFREIEPTVMSVVQGFKASIMSFGQSGSGKTYTMFGTENDIGLVAESIKLIFESTHDRFKHEQWQYTISLNAVEVYNDVVVDLLADENDSNGNHCAKRSQSNLPWNVSNSSSKIHRYELIQHKVDIHYDNNNDAYLDGVVTLTPEAYDDALTIVKNAIMTRRTSSTLTNDVSSRSHCLVTLTVSGKDSTGKKSTEGLLSLVDLAGSERLYRSEAIGEQQKESISINKSLTSLADVMIALQKATSKPSSQADKCTNHVKTQHIPYRNSTLTKLLSSSLCCNSKCVLIVNISPDVEDIKETQCSLNFGMRSRNVSLGKAKKITDDKKSNKKSQNCTSQYR